VEKLSSRLGIFFCTSAKGLETSKKLLFNNVDKLSKNTLLCRLLGCILFFGTTIADISAMETKLPQINSILDLPIKATSGNQRASSSYNSTDETSFLATKREYSSDDSSVNKQSDGFEKALKKKINIDDEVQCKENEPDVSDESDGTKDAKPEVHHLPEQAVNIAVAEPVEQVAVQMSITDVVDSLNEGVQALAQPEQNSGVSSDNVLVPEVQVVTNTQALPQQTEQGTTGVADQQQAVAGDVAGDAVQDELPQVKTAGAQLVQNEQMPTKDETLQNKPVDATGQTDQQVASPNTKVGDSAVKNALKMDAALPKENEKSQEEPQIVVSNAPKQVENLTKTENLSQIKPADSASDKSDQVKPVENSQDSAFENSTKQKPSTPVDNLQPTLDSTESTLASDSNTFGAELVNTVEIDVAAKVEAVQPHAPVTTDISINTQQAEPNKEVSQAQNIENLSQSVAKQMQNSVNIALNRNQNQIVVNLSPPELGRVTIKFIENQNEISGVLQVSKPEIRAELQSALPQIIRNLEASGIQVKRIDVEVYDQNNISQQGSKDQSFQGNFSAQQDSAQNQSNSGNTANTSFESNKAHILSEENQTNSTLGSGSINMFA